MALRSAHGYRAGSDGPRLLNIREAAERLGVGKDWVYDRVNSGEIPVVELGSTRKKQRIREHDLAEFIDQRTYGARDATTRDRS